MENVASNPIEGAYEFDAPMYYDFRRESLGTSGASHWFVAQAQKDELRSPLAEVSSKLASQTITRNNNIVTGWGKPRVDQQASLTVTGVHPAPSTTAKSKSSLQRLAAPRPGLVQKTPSQTEQVPLNAPKDTTKTAPTLAALEPEALQSNKAMAVSGGEAAEAASSILSKNSKEQMCVVRSSGKIKVKTASHAKMLKAALSSARSARNLRTAEHAAAAAAVGARKDTQLLKLRACAGVSSSMPALKSNGIKKPTKRPMKVAQASVAIRRITGRKAARSGLTATPTPAATTAASRKAHQIALAGRSIAARKSERLKRVLAPKKVLPSYSTKPLTMPEEPHLRVNKRLRSGCAKDAGASTQTAHASTPYKPLAAKVKEFESKTPARFKSRALPVELTKPLTRTEPVEPQLHTTMRARPPRFKPTTQLEVEEMEAMPKFHAQPLNHELLACRPSQPVPEPRQPIQQQPFHFVTDLRHERRGRMQEEADTAAAAAEQFRAKPLRKSILEAPTYVPKKSRMSLTIPKSPLLLTKTRSHKVEVEEPKQEFKARPVPSFLQVPKEFMGPSQPELTQPQPFPLCTELRGRLHQERLQAKLLEAEVEAAEARRIKAQLLPLTTDVPLLPPRPEPKPLTVPQPFTLRSEARHEGYIAELSAHLAEEEQHKKQEAEFKARPVWHGIPFQPQPCDLALTVPQEVHLATEVRAVVRQDFDQFMEEKMRAAAEEKAAAEHAARLAEEAATREYRRSLRFKAAPVPAFPAPSPVAPSDKPLTKAKTPKLGRKRKQDEGL